jgi:hypothetical protein
MAVFITKQSAYATGTVSGASLTWTRISRVQRFSGAIYNNGELWYAYTAGGFTSQSLTLTSSAATDATEFSGFCVSGANATAQLDPNNSLPATSNTGVDISLTYSTTLADDLIIAYEGESGGTSAPAAPTGYTSLVNAANGNGAVRYAHLTVWYKSVSATQSETVSTGFSKENPVGILTAATADAPPVAGVAGARTLLGVGN